MAPLVLGPVYCSLDVEAADVTVATTDAFVAVDVVGAAAADVEADADADAEAVAAIVTAAAVDVEDADDAG